MTASRRAIRLAAGLHVLLGIGFGAGAALTLWHLDRHGELPMTPFGFRSLAGGPFERLDRGAFMGLGSALVAVCALDVLAGAWLWRGHRRGAVLGLGTNLPALVLAWGFALPFLLAGVPLRFAMLLLGRKAID